MCVCVCVFSYHLLLPFQNDWVFLLTQRPLNLSFESQTLEESETLPVWRVVASSASRLCVCVPLRAVAAPPSPCQPLWGRSTAPGARLRPASLCLAALSLVSYGCELKRPSPSPLGCRFLEVGTGSPPGLC